MRRSFCLLDSVMRITSLREAEEHNFASFLYHPASIIIVIFALYDVVKMLRLLISPEIMSNYLNFLR